MSFWYFFFGIIGIIAAIILIFGLPRKKSERQSNIEGIYSPEAAKAFERMTNLPPFKILHRKVVSCLKELNPSGKLIDVGCGSGNLIVEIAKKYLNLELIGIDISPEILEYAKKRTVKKMLDEKVEFKIGSAENLPFPDNSIDIAVSTLSLHHWEDPTKSFKEIYRVVKENGSLVIFDFRRDSRKFFYGFLKFITRFIVPKALKMINEPIGSIQSSYTSQEIEEIFTQISVKNIKIKPFLAWMFIVITK